MQDLNGKWVKYYLKYLKGRNNYYEYLIFVAFYSFLYCIFEIIGLAIIRLILYIYKARRRVNRSGVYVSFSSNEYMDLKNTLSPLGYDLIFEIK